MASRFQAFLEANRDQLPLDKLRDGVPPLTAIMLATQFFFQYYGIELLFGVPNRHAALHDGRETGSGEPSADGVPRAASQPGGTCGSLEGENLTRVSTVLSMEGAELLDVRRQCVQLNAETA
jgi:hypothetical protein